MGPTVLVFWYGGLLGLGLAVLRMAANWIGWCQIQPRSRRSLWWLPRLMLFLAFVEKAYLDQPLNQLAHHQLPPLPWSGVVGHLLQYGIDAIVLTFSVEVVTSAGLYLKFRSYRRSLSTTTILVLQLIRVVVTAGAAAAHDVLSADDFLVSLALVVLSAWALGLGALHEIRDILDGEDFERQPSERRYGSRRRSLVSWLLLSQVAGVFGTLALLTDSVLKYLSSGAVVLLYAVVAAVSDVVGDRVNNRADKAFDSWWR
ncbi:hypothetical protein [Amycolatopsis sp. NPDC051903]|uniref:hypothetical protein n=1 Tax=Amycolatopsis sp. NPDC051903 TaxID=3363936 RepID=UPI0037B7AC7F